MVVRIKRRRDPGRPRRGRRLHDRVECPTPGGASDRRQIAATEFPLKNVQHELEDRLIFVPVTDVDRSKEFYERIGFKPTTTRHRSTGCASCR